MKLKLFLRRLSVSAPRMTIRRHVHWTSRVALQLAVLFVFGAAAVWLWHHLENQSQLESDGLRSQISDLNQRASVQDRKIDDLSRDLRQAQNEASLEKANLLIERASVARLSAQLLTLESENARLKADLTYMESLLPAGNSEGPIAIRRLDVRPDQQAGRMRYRAMLTQDARADREFEGSWQLSVTLETAKGSQTITLPQEAGDMGMAISFRRYQRIEGIFDVPQGAKVRSAQLRVFENGTLRASQSAIL